MRTFVLTLADIDLSQRSLQTGADPRALVEPQQRRSRALELIEADHNKQQLWAAVGDNGRLDLCSSFGILNASGTVNIDLAEFTSPIQDWSGLDTVPPLWPCPSNRLDNLVPSNPDGLSDWRPIGLMECLFGSKGMLV